MTCAHCDTDQSAPEAAELRVVKDQHRSVQAQLRELRNESQALEIRRDQLEAVLRSRRSPVAAHGPVFVARPVRSSTHPFEIRPDRIRDVLLWAGAALVMLSAVSLGAVFWARDSGDGPPLITPTRLAVFLDVLAAAIALVSWSLRRRLPATAEVLAALPIGLVLVAWFLLRRGGTAEGVDVAVWWGGGLTVVAVLALIGGCSGFRALRGLAPPSFTVAAAVFLTALPGGAAARAVAAAGLAIAFVGGARLALDARGWQLAGVGLLVAAGVFTVAGGSLAVISAQSAPSAGDELGTVVAMVALGGGVAVARSLLRERVDRLPPLADVLACATTLALIGAAVVVSIAESSTRGVITTAAVAGLLAVTVGRAAGDRLGPGIAVAGVVAMTPGLAVAVGALAVAIFVPLAWFAEPWSVDVRGRADLRLEPGGTVRIRNAGWALELVAV